MKISSGIVIGKDDAAGASAVRKPPEDRRCVSITLTLAWGYTATHCNINEDSTEDNVNTVRDLHVSSSIDYTD
jgi:hypothetical protein